MGTAGRRQRVDCGFRISDCGFKKKQTAGRIQKTDGGRQRTAPVGGWRSASLEVGGKSLRVSNFILQQMTAKRNDLMTVQPYDAKPNPHSAIVPPVAHPSPRSRDTNS